MAHVNVTIGGRPYRMACEDGEEAHLEELAATIDGRIAEMRASFGEIGDQRLIVMAAISILDEAHDLRGKLEKLEAEMAGLSAAMAGAESAGESWAQSLAEALESSAARIERLARDIGPAR
jgi:cell division protein ZapA